MYLKSEKSETIPALTLTELSGLQRIQYVEYLAKEEEKLTSPDIEPSEVNKGLISMNIRVSAHLLALSLYHSDPKAAAVKNTEQSHELIENITNAVLETWGLENIFANAYQVRKISGMLPKEVDVPADADSEAEKEPVTAEKL